ncbi:hypothetical protein CYMTET_3027 [Cymbomonas tetramitiformis]|uniref:Uncharacterized protein n=1 Tax=Cymbomonas tetramitiformis TaxID=36881 RepID=A0AAE0LLZ1_9CHLO|nr:hypothetical protein CYMTET_3027 [Cymbomonas tetramitiformis]
MLTSHAMAMPRSPSFGYACTALALASTLAPTFALCSSADEDGGSDSAQVEEEADWDQLRKLESLKDDGIIDTPDFKKYRNRLLDKLTAKPASHEKPRNSKRKSKTQVESQDDSDCSDEVQPPRTRPSKASKDLECPSGLAPKRIRNNLRLKYKKTPKFLDLIPSVHQIQNRKRKHTRERLRAIKFETAADLSEFTNAHLLPPSKEDALALDKDELIVLPDGVFSLEDGTGFVFSSVGLLENVVRAKAAWGSSMPSETDGTYKIVYNGWPCLVYGTYTLKYNKERNCIQHSFVPFAFMMAKSESTAAYAAMFRSTNAAGERTPAPPGEEALVHPLERSCSVENAGVALGIQHYIDPTALKDAGMDYYFAY